MKRLIILITAFVSLGYLKAQSIAEMPRPFHVYGIDYSIAKIYGEKLRPSDEFSEAFQNINLLLLSEPNKYDFSRILNTSNYKVDIRPAINNIAAGEYSLELKTDKEITISQTDIQNIVNGYQIKDTLGTGVVFVALKLDKSAGRAYYDIVFFDLTTRRIFSTYRRYGYCQGFGLRNFWANTVYECLISPLELSIRKKRR